MNVDRTVRNTNMLWWHKELWLIDHGASLYFHHAWDNWDGAKAFPKIKDHVFLSKATELDAVNSDFSARLSAEKIREIILLIPDDWLTESPFDTIDQHRRAYVDFLTTRLLNSHTFIEEAQHAGK